MSNHATHCINGMWDSKTKSLVTRTFEKCVVLHFNTFDTKSEVIIQTKETTTGSKVIY